MSISYVVVSSGGCGSKFLVHTIGQHVGETRHQRHHSHERNPSAAFFSHHGRVIVLFTNPVDAVISFFGRRLHKTALHGYDGRVGPGIAHWVVQHCRHIGGRHAELNPQWGLAEYLQQGEDLFQLEGHLRNWLDYSGTEEILFLRYEAMWDQVDHIARHLGLGGDFAKRFGARQARASCVGVLAEPQRSQALRMYGSACALVESLDDAFLRAQGHTRVLSPRQAQSVSGAR